MTANIFLYISRAQKSQPIKNLLNTTIPSQKTRHRESEYPKRYLQSSDSHVFTAHTAYANGIARPAGGRAGGAAAGPGRYCAYIYWVKQARPGRGGGNRTRLPPGAPKNPKETHGTRTPRQRHGGERHVQCWSVEIRKSETYMPAPPGGKKRSVDSCATKGTQVCTF